MSSLRTAQSKSYFTNETKESHFRREFGLPDSESSIAEVHGVLSLQGKDEAYNGKLYLSQTFLSFASLDKKGCRLALALYTIRRVEKVAALDGLGLGAFALSLTLFHGARIILQLNSLKPTNDDFCYHLRIRLKACLPKMKTLQPFAETFFSEFFLASSHTGGEVDMTAIKSTSLIDLEEEKVAEKVSSEWTTESGMGRGYHGGLGLIFNFPGDARKLREKSKMKLWKEYFLKHGRNLTLIRYPGFNRLVQVGLPNRLRGEIWEQTSGALFLRLENPGLYARLLEENKGRSSASTDDIEKDLHRSLPEYAGFQSPTGIDAMRRVLTTYSFYNPTLGYCQAMNLVVACLLIFTSEEQCFFILSILCDRLLQGYYSPSMYGTVLDQKVFEQLVERCLPSIHEHFANYDIQLSVSSLPWFLSCYISSMPMVFAFRIIDCFFAFGPSVLFQIGLAILKINGDELLECTDDGAFINTMKHYFTTLGDSAYPNSVDSRLRSITRFQELLVIAFREFSSITEDVVMAERRRHQKAVVVSIENFAKRSTLRNLKYTGRLDKNQLEKIYDHFQLALLRSRAAQDASRGRSGSKEDDSKLDERIDRKAFGNLLGDISTWARDEKIVRTGGFYEHVERNAVDHELINRLFVAWDNSRTGRLALQDVIMGLDSVLFNDLMANIAWFFRLHDADTDGFLTKEEVLQLSESLLFIFRNEPGDRYLGSVSNLLHNAFEYAESTKVEVEGTEASEADAPLVSQNPDQPYLGLATFRMVILADELLEGFFDEDLRKSWHLETLIAEERPQQPGAVGWLNSIISTIVTDDNKERLNNLADLAGKSLRIQSVESRPSIGKFDAASAAILPTRAGSLLSRSLPPVPSTNAPPASSTSLNSNPLSAAAMRDTPAYPHQLLPPIPPSSNPWIDSLSKNDSAFEIAAAARTTMDRPVFREDSIIQDREDSEEVDGVEDEVDRFVLEDDDDEAAEKEEARVGKAPPQQHMMMDNTFSVEPSFVPSHHGSSAAWSEIYRSSLRQYFAGYEASAEKEIPKREEKKERQDRGAGKTKTAQQQQTQLEFRSSKQGATVHENAEEHRAALMLCSMRTMKLTAEDGGGGKKKIGSNRRNSEPYVVLHRSSLFDPSLHAALRERRRSGPPHLRTDSFP